MAHACFRSKYSINTYQEIYMPCSEELSCVSRTTSHYETKPPTTKTTTTVPTNDDIQTKINDIKILILRERKKATTNQQR